jgi:hypothetical protein
MGLSVRWVEGHEWSAADPSGRFAVNLNREEDLVLLEDRGWTTDPAVQSPVARDERWTAKGGRRNG